MCKYKTEIRSLLIPIVFVSALADAAHDIVHLPAEPEPDPPGLVAQVGVERDDSGSTAHPGVSGEIANGRRVDLEGMSAYMNFVLGNDVVGYAFVINQDGMMAFQKAGGMARTASDGALNMTVDTRTAIASVTKNITAAATIKALDMAGVSLDAAVSDYLPADWVTGAGFSDNGVTFRQLLTHESGLKQMFDAMSESDKPEWTNEWDGLQFIVSNGAMPGASYAYKNANYALMRVLVPRLWVLSGAGPVTPITQANHAAIFLTFVSQYVLEPAGIFNTSCTASSQFDQAYYYSFDFIEEGGNLAEYSLPACGGTGGFRLSAMELARYLAHLEHSTNILTDAQRQAMDDGRLGWFPSASDDKLRKSGQYFAEYDLPGDGSGAGGVVLVPDGATYRKETHACVMKLPQSVEVSLLVNSSKAGGGNFEPCDLISSAFELYGG